MPDGTGTLIAGRYVLTESAGGRRWAAHDQLLDREVVLQEIQLPPEPSAGLRARALAQARAAARLDHPNLAPVYDVVEAGDAPWIVLRAASGPTLSAEIARSGPLPAPRALRIGQQVAAALACAHAAAVVHGNLTTDSVLLDGSPADRAVVSGFGAAGLADADAGVDADLYALGVVLHTATEGSPPDPGGRLRPARPARPLGALIESLLAADPAQRPRAESVTATLAALAMADPATAEPPLATEPTPESEPPPAKPARGGSLAGLAGPVRPRSALTVGGIIAVAMVIVLGLLVVLLGNHAKPESAGSVSSATLSGTLTDPDGYRAQDVAFSADGATIAASFAASAASAAHVDVWDSPSGQPSRVLSDPAGGGTGALAFSPKDAAALAVAGRGVVVWNLAAGSSRSYAAPDGQPAVGVGYAPDGDSVAESGRGGGLYELNLARGQWTTLLAAVAGNSGGPVAVSPDGKTVAAADAAGQVRLWSASGGAARVITGAVTGTRAQAMAFSPDGKTLAVAAASGSVRLWNGASGPTAAPLTGSGSSPQAVAFSPDGATLAVGDADGTVYLWDLASRSETSVSLPAGAAGAVTTLAFSPDGNTLAVASDGAARVYLYNLKYTAS